MIEFSNNDTNSFIADTKGIKELKATFLYEGNPKYLYLRKGEDVGAELIALLYGYMLNVDWSELFTTSVGIYGLFQSYKSSRHLKDIKKKLDHASCKKIKDFRILCTKNDETKRAKMLYKELGTLVKYRTLPELDKMRFYLTNEKYALFLRTGSSFKPLFIGHTGTEKTIIKRLKKAFIEEWNST